MNTTRIIHRVITETPVSLSIKIDKNEHWHKPKAQTLAPHFKNT
jgi:hypothetical protein